MGSRSRRAKKMREINALPTMERLLVKGEYTTKVTLAEMGRVARKPQWITEVESRGFQHIKGSRAPIINQSQNEKRTNRRKRRELGSALVVHDHERTPPGDRTHTEALLSGREFTRSEDWNAVH